MTPTAAAKAPKDKRRARRFSDRLDELDDRLFSTPVVPLEDKSLHDQKALVKMTDDQRIALSWVIEGAILTMHRRVWHRTFAGRLVIALTALASAASILNVVLTTTGHHP